MPTLSTPLSHISSPVKQKEENKTFFPNRLNPSRQQASLNERSTSNEKMDIFRGEGGYAHISFIQTINMLKGDYAIPDRLITSILHQLFEKSSKRWYYGTRQKHFQNTFLGGKMITRGTK
ncbi:hypothetical protein O181_088893 [Austropuccinia psidii MF-1]|uniref:Uncharacterized protein n=1 Tax=Austropuccinia psidii MF-1 TaxID=1389203 RepID=A0A9Q3ISG1_9BASI|nr:hypothetical protein [Austropuccinia psidii MF-1]